MQTVQVVYDIPEKPSYVGKDGKRKKIGPQANEMRKRGGFMMQYSTYIFPKDRVPVDYIESLIEKGAHVGTYDFAESQWPKIKADCLRAMQAESDQIRTAMTNGLMVTCEKLEKMLAENTYDTLDDVEKKFMKYAKDGQTHILWARDCVAAFDLTGDTSELFKASDHYIKARVNAMLKTFDTVRVRANKKAEEDKRKATLSEISSMFPKDLSDEDATICGI